MRGKIGPSGINDEAPKRGGEKGEEKGGPVLLFEAKNRPTGRGIHHILIYFPPSHLLVSNIGKKKLDLLTYKNQKFWKHSPSQTFSPTYRHGPESWQASLNIFKFLILRSFHLHAFSATQYFLFYVFKLLLHLNYSFFPQTLETRRNQKESFH